MDIMVWLFWQQKLPVAHEVSALSNSSIFNPNSIAYTIKIPIECIDKS